MIITYQRLLLVILKGNGELDFGPVEANGRDLGTKSLLYISNLSPLSLTRGSLLLLLDFFLCGYHDQSGGGQRQMGDCSPIANWIAGLWQKIEMSKILASGRVASARRGGWRGGEIREIGPLAVGQLDSCPIKKIEMSKILALLEIADEGSV